MPTKLITFVIAFFLLLSADPAEAQYDRAAIGGGVGVLGGGVVTLSLIVARARLQGEYLDSADDLFHWQTAPMILTPAVGVGFGLAGRDPLVASIIGSTTGMLIGAAAGATAGWLLSESPEAPWAGGVMGAGLGMTVGGLLMGIRAIAQDDDDAAETVLPPIVLFRMRV